MGYILGSFSEPIPAWESSLVTSAVFLGMLFGGIIGTVMGDKYGRRVLMIVCLAVNGVSGLCAAASPTLVWMSFFRFVAGVGIGGIAPMLFAVCLEHVPASARGKYITIISAFWMLGSIFTAVLAWVMLGCYWGTDIRIMNVSWRVFSLAASLPAFISCALIYLYVPESPRFLVAKGKYQQASDTLTLIYAINGRSRLPDFSGGVDRQVPSRASDSLQWTDRFLLMFDSSGSVINLKFTTLVLLSATFCLSFVSMCRIEGCYHTGSYGISTWVTRVFQSTNVHNPYANDILYAAAALPGNYDVLSAEVYPLHIRVSALCFLSSMGRFGATLAQIVNGFLMGPPVHIQALLVITTVVMAIGGGSVMLLDDNVDVQGGLQPNQPTTESHRLLA
ncbi:hypothetical protein DYB34_006604 [Aphanomyces astaci]|uniref:Major facilitator superfamily (MFS) profile domain-containing protein n=1 Tax=Aphanomyces astaci TaxID=112090 RepID=A0A3R6WVK3_APHAT|nr:hypothetical protein DYB34_006604 [Aphanomyces astaci]